jgi:hypothetical protein
MTSPESSNAYNTLISLRDKLTRQTQEMLLAMIQDHHQKQITQMEATNKANMDAMMEKMNSLVAANKENTHQNGNSNAKSNSTGKKERKPKQKKVLCPNCKCFVFHKPNCCYKLKANKADWYPG